MWGGRGSSNGASQGAAKNFARLAATLHAEFPHWSHVPIDYRWHGLICMTRRLTPAIGRLDDDPSVFFGFGYHGNGVNTSTGTGQRIAEWLGNSRRGDTAVPDAVPGIMRGMTGRFPLASMRLFYIQARVALFRLTDWLY